MKIRFITLDGLEQVLDCDQIEGPVSTVYRPCWKAEGECQPIIRAPGCMNYREYENRYSSPDDIPTVHEVGPKL